MGMTENELREKVIKGLEICSAGEWNSTGGRDHTDCPYYPAGYTGCTCKLLMRDALALLKAQEPVVAYWIPCNGKSHIWYCSECGEKINYNDARRTYKTEKKSVEAVNRYCRGCGATMVQRPTDEQREAIPWN